jgi:hypothetical protein
MPKTPLQAHLDFVVGQNEKVSEKKESTVTIQLDCA